MGAWEAVKERQKPNTRSERCDVKKGRKSGKEDEKAAAPREDGGLYETKPTGHTGKKLGAGRSVCGGWCVRQPISKGLNLGSQLLVIPASHRHTTEGLV